MFFLSGLSHVREGSIERLLLFFGQLVAEFGQLYYSQVVDGWKAEQLLVNF